MKLLSRGRWWYKCKLLFVAIVTLHVLQLLWFYLHDDNQSRAASPGNNVQSEVAMMHLRNNLDRAGENGVIDKDDNSDGPANHFLKAGNAFLNLVEKEKDTAHAHEGCSPLVPFRDVWPDTISTFDIPDVANYSLDEKGRYFLPRKATVSRDVQADEKDVQEEDVHVTLIPFSHTDPGYGMTMEGYYQSFTKNVLDLMVDKLSIYSNMTFQWAETVFLERWFRDITPARRAQVKSLLKNGQFEIVLGGWVMPDEASTRYTSVVDQMIEGHAWLAENLAVIPENAWVNDPFGYSSTMPYLWRESGVDNMVILRIHQAVKAFLMSKNSLEFTWRPYWERTSGSDVLCNLMAYEGYWNSNVCGPKEDVCKLFNFLHLDRRDPGGAKPVDSKNVQELSQTLYEQYKFTSSLYKYNNLVIFLGEDNSYSTPNSWDDTYKNYEYLMNAINNNPQMKMKIEFGTLKSYFARVRKSQTAMSAKSHHAGAFPVLSGDFFPYSDWEHAYWTGYFTTRPWLKKFSRVVEAVVRSADLFSVMAYDACIGSQMYPDVQFKGIHEALRTARRELGMFQHHDGITGTSLPYVVSDYETRLTNAYNSAYRALKQSLLALLTKGKASNSDLLQFNSPRVGLRAWYPDKPFTLAPGKLSLVFANPSERKRREVVSIRLRLKSPTVSITLEDRPGADIPYQVTTPYARPGTPTDNLYIVSFVIDLKPLMVQTIIIAETSASRVMTKVEETAITLPAEQLMIENAKLKVMFDSTTGMIDTIVDNTGKALNVRSEFLAYSSKKSGAYLFGPGGPASPIKNPNHKADILLTKGPIVSEVTVTYKTGFSHRVRLYNVSGTQGETVHVQNQVDLNKSPHLFNSEIIWRLKTDIKSGNIFFTDQNAFQYMGRKTYPDRLIESNFYPVTTMAFLEDDVMRLSVHVAQPHGVASLASGWAEFMLDRTMTSDDGRGLGQGVTDKVLAVSDFVLQVEYKRKRAPLTEQRYNFPTVNSLVASEYLQNPVNVFAVQDKTELFSAAYGGLTDESPLPCDVSIVGLRHLVSNELKLNGTSLVLHRKSYSCLYSDENSACASDKNKLTLADLNLGQTRDSAKPGSFIETSLSHLHTKRNVDLIEDICPDVQKLRSFLLKT